MRREAQNRGYVLLKTRIDATTSRLTPQVSSLTPHVSSLKSHASQVMSQVVTQSGRYLCWRENCPERGLRTVVNIRYDAPYIPGFNTGLIQLGESGKYEGKENIPLLYYRQSRRKPPEEETENSPPKDDDHQIDLLA